MNIGEWSYKRARLWPHHPFLKHGDFGRLEPVGGDWGQKVVEAFKADFGDEL
jgi:hypothetical protein